MHQRKHAQYTGINTYGACVCQKTGPDRQDNKTTSDSLGQQPRGQHDHTLQYR